ncbi:L-lactate dehydrogenase (quinone) large subunit LdhH [Desulfospira joergensenii]|uniref:L-lactate dehydrogenase (quinone) large subunit LdhH n=1 Tax=Desulfospira joergensenii TaxID=53329 RepID=UPI000480C369|nr:LUD domain-containing protein [Desulfospira joergensenii]
MENQESLKSYKSRLDAALGNEFLRRAMDNFAVAYRTSRENAFSGMDVDGLIREVAEIKARAVQDNEALLEKFTKNAEAKGIHVHLADTAEDANRIIGEIALKTGSRRIAKSKSMTAEETHLNKWLENMGLEVTETDLGEWIVQLRKEGPSHMVMPAIHLSRYQVSDLFTDVTGEKQDAKIEDLVRVARKELREKFVNADLGITGANYAVAETATIGITTNEGNARLVSTLPRVHVALVGIDKLLPGLKEALTINRVLPKNATGQAITSYVTWITGPSECRIADNGKREMHIVFLDNGRKKIANDPMFSQILQCVRCGACANVCPVYRMVGGHQLGHIYIGAIGLITTYFFHGREHARNLVQNCTNCGACKAVCAGGINLPKLIKAVHARIQDEEGHPLKSLLLAKVLKSRKLFHTLLRTASLAQKPVTGGTPYLRHLPMIFAKEHNFRVLPAIAETPFRKRFEKLNKTVEKPRVKIALFSGCVQDFVYPEHLEAAMKSFASLDVKVSFPMDQTCCGLPAVSMGEKSAARDVALQNIEAFAGEDVDYIVTLCASCASHLKHGMIDLVKNYADEKAEAFSEKIISYSQFMNQVLKVDSRDGAQNRKIAFHSPCHLCRGLGVKEDPRQLIDKSGNTYVPTREEETCCGFGGSFSANFPAVSNEILTQKLDDVEGSGADLLVTECPGCVMQLRGGAMKQNRDIEVLHLAELFDEP